MRRLWFIPMLVFLVSCDFFLSREAQTEKIVDEELMTIDWDDVDQFPLFDECDENAIKTEQRECFKREMLRRFVEAFSDTVYEVNQEIKDTVLVDFLVDEDGFVYIQQIEDNNRIEELIPGFKEEVRTRFKDVTVIPAHKRGIDVKVRFRLPIVLDTQQ